MLPWALKQLFWADSLCRSEYKKYGEAIMFNTTDNTDKYKLFIDIFCSINTHLSFVLFATNFLANESVESFIWLFFEFKKCMDGYPKTIITDQDPVMKVELSHELPNTFHRLCKWHITHKICDKVEAVYRNKVEMNIFNCILNTSETVEEFESGWDK